MKLRNPFLIENLMQDQPYCSLLLVAPYCDRACPGCQNAPLVEHEVMDFSVEELVRRYRSNPFVDGITVGGLEVCLSGDEFLRDLVAFVAAARVPRVTLYSRFELGTKRLRTLIQALESLECVSELYCKTGAFWEGTATKEITLFSAVQTPWTLRLASSNQNWHIVKGSAWQLTFRPRETNFLST